jgi:hypothetical protein
MAEELKEKKEDEVVPTLFIALGGTGAEVLWRIRRRILNNLWGVDTGQPVRLEQLTEFPFAEFLQIDLDANTVTESGKALKSDILGTKVRFKEEERLVKKLDMSKYTKSDDELAKYPLVQEWFPLTRSKVNELNIDPEKGAGQIRAISRLYFFDKYAEIKGAIRTKSEHLMANVTSADMQKRLGLKVQTGTLKIVVVASTAGGTGSGSFLDLGYLASVIGKQTANQGVATNLVLMLPTGYQGANRTRTQANTYAALMELETCMRQGSKYIRQWNENETIREMPETPYSDVYLIDTSNVAAAQTEDIKDLYDMVADALFEDFSTAEFANKKRSISVNQNQHKTTPFISRVDRNTYGDMKLTYSRAYSSFGQSIIDTHLDQKQNIVISKQVNGMLKAFFGISTVDAKNNMPTEQERDELLANRLFLGMDNEIIEYDFVRQTDSFYEGVERTSYPIIRELLRINGMSRLDGIEKKITDTFEDIRISGGPKEWPSKIAETINQINHDTFKAVETGSGLHEDTIKKRRTELLNELLDPNRGDGLIKALWARVDNKERGGLDYTIDLIQRLKDRMENANTGLVKALDENAKWFADLSGHLRNEETSTLQDHLNQAINKLLGPHKVQSEAKLKQISTAVRLYVRYHLYATASKEAVTLVQELSESLGKKVGTDADGNPEWSGFLKELESGRAAVRGIINDVENQISRTNEAMKQGHAMYFVLPAPRSKIDEIELLPQKQAIEWAEKAFEDFGGTQQLFSMMVADDGRSELLGKLRNRALTLVTDESVTDITNPLFTALDSHPNRIQLFGEFLQRAMPWSASKVDHFLKQSDPNDQYKCLIGVKSSKEFETRYGEELRNRVPSLTMMTRKEIQFVEIHTPGKLVCFIELSGLPLPSLKALDDWYTAYKEESVKIPVHTHKRTSTFVHPREWTTEELARRTEDFKLFVQAVALGVLKRTEKGEEASLYKVKAKGSAFNVGDEKWLRLEGLHITRRPEIQRQVELDLEALESIEQLAIWASMLIYYQESVYPLAVKTVDGVDIEQKSLPTMVCEELVNEWKHRLKTKIGDDHQAERKLRNAQDVLNKWSEEVPGSNGDVYAYEVNIKEIKNKRVFKREIFQPNWTLQGIQTDGNPNQGSVVVPPPFPTSIVAPPPPMQVDTQFHIMVGAQQYGPYNLQTLAGFVPTGQLTPQSMVWRPGLATWLSASQVPELSGLFLPPSEIAPPPPPLPPSA